MPGDNTGSLVFPTSAHACTIVARNYLAQAEVLARSFREHHPDIPFTTLVIDGIPDDRARPNIGRVLFPTELGLDPDVIGEMSVLYDVMEYATALKPALLMALIREGATSAAYFDPDIRVYAPVPDVFSEAERHGILLTPHTIHPIPRDGKYLGETSIMQAGIYNLGFIAVGAMAYRFLNWWHERLRTDAIVDVARGLFTDQRWIDWVPSLFPHKISRDQGLNAAYWNMHERPISSREGRWFAGDAPLRFFHFSGYDPALPWLLSKHLGDKPRTVLSGNVMLRALCNDYKAELEDSGHLELRRNPYLLRSLSNGVVLTPSIRSVYRSVANGTITPSEPAPNPRTDADGFTRWLLGGTVAGCLTDISILDFGLWSSRSDLQSAFSDVRGLDGAHFRNWLLADPEARKAIDALRTHLPAQEVSLLPETRIPAAAPIRRAFGWSVVAYATSELGVGEAGRRVLTTVSQTGIPAELVAVPGAFPSRQEHRSRVAVRVQISFENTIVCVNADQLPLVAESMRLGSLRGRKIGLWFWELETFPEHYRGAFSHVHEVWVTSEFTRRAIQPLTDKRVHLVPLPTELPLAPTEFTRGSLGLPRRSFLFLTNFDYLSVYRRKNPEGVIRAYIEAFGPHDGATLVVKSINGHHRPLDVENVRSFAAGRDDIVFLDDYVSSAGMKAMLELADCYVSLHRSEGYGLNMVDAMAHGTPVIATAYSGNMEFMTPDTAELVPYTLAQVGPLAAPYDPAAVWAEPDLRAASEAMRRVFDEPARAAALALRAQKHVARTLSRAAVATAVKPLLMPQLVSAPKGE